MIGELMQEKDLDHRLNFDQLPSLASLVNETFDETPNTEANEIYSTSGRLNSSFLLRNAKILLAAEDYELAKTIFQTLIEHGESLGAAYAGLGVCYEHEDKIDLAIKAYREAIIYEPSYTSLIALADLFIRKQDHKNAVNTLLRANHLPRIKKRESYEIHKNLGNCYIRLDQLDHAESHYRNAFELIPDSDVLHVNIGCLALRKQNPALALMHFNEALRIQPQNGNALTGIGLAHLLKSEKRAAHDAFAKSLEINIGDLTALFYLIKAAYEIEHYSVAAEMLKRYISSKPYNGNILYALAGLLYHLGDFQACIAECSRLIEIKPNHEGAIKLKLLAQEKIK